MAVRFLAVGAGLQSLLTDDIVNHLTFERIHRLQVDRLAGLPDLIDRIQCDIVQTLALALQEAVDIDDETGTLAGLLLDRKPGQLLQGVDHFAVASDEMLVVGSVIGDDLNRRAAVADTHFDIALVVGDIQKLFKIIGGDVSFLVELIHGLLVILCHIYSFSARIDISLNQLPELLNDSPE